MSVANEFRANEPSTTRRSPLPAGADNNISLPQAQFEEARALAGKGPALLPRAAELFRAAADAGHTVATAWLARCYWCGHGVEESEAECGRLVRIALDEQGLRSLANQGDASAQHALGSMYSNGRGVAMDAREAVAWFRKSAEQGDAEAQCELGFAYRNGEGVEIDTNEVVTWLRKSAEQGHAEAQCALGFAYEGEGVTKDDREAAMWSRKSAEQGWAHAQLALGYAHCAGYGVAIDEGRAVQWFRKAAEQDHDEAQRLLDEWDTTLADVATGWQVIYDPDPHATVVEADVKVGWLRGASGEAEQEEAYEGESQQDEGLLRRMSPWMVRCQLNLTTLECSFITMPEVRRMVEEACCECGCDASVVTSSDATELDGVYRVALRVRALAGNSTCPSRQRAAEDAAAGGSSESAVQTHEARELTICRPDGTSHKLAASPPTTILEVKQHVRREVRGGAADATGADESARPFFWQDEHAVQRQHIFVQGSEDELADARSMGSLGSPSALFLMVDTEASFMERLETAAVALQAELGAVKLHNLARCDAAAAVQACGSEGGDSRPPCKKSRVQQ